MSAGRKIITHIATSADGYIARLDGSVDWLNERARGDYGMTEFYSSIDTILWGRKTYDWALNYAATHEMKWDVFDKKLVHYAFSKNPPNQVAEGVKFVTEPIPAFARRLRAEPGKNIWMMGGGGLIASFLDAGEIDEFDIHVIPVFIGEGIALIAPRYLKMPLEVLALKKHGDGTVRLRYGVGRG